MPKTIPCEMFRPNKETIRDFFFFFLQETTEQKKSEGGGKGKKIIPKKLLHAGWTYGSVGRQITASI